MQESPSRALEWFRARSNPQKTAVAFAVAVVGLIVQAVRRRPVRIWLIAGGAALVGVMVSGTFVDSIYGPVNVDRAQVTRVEEPVAEDEPGLEQRGVEGEILATVAGAERQGSVENVEVAEQADGGRVRYEVLVTMDSREVADATLLEATEDHEHVYRSVYIYEIADQTSNVAVVSRVDGPTMTLDPAYETSMDRETVREIDWRSATDVQNLHEYWEEEYVAEELREQR